MKLHNRMGSGASCTNRGTLSKLQELNSAPSYAMMQQPPRHEQGPTGMEKVKCCALTLLRCNASEWCAATLAANFQRRTSTEKRPSRAQDCKSTARADTVALPLHMAMLRPPSRLFDAVLVASILRQTLTHRCLDVDRRLLVPTMLITRVQKVIFKAENGSSRHAHGLDCSDKDPTRSGGWWLWPATEPKIADGKRRDHAILGSRRIVPRSAGATSFPSNLNVATNL